ncbi:hypothetical protein [Nitrospira sp. Nam74]
MEVEHTMQQWSLGGSRIKWGALLAGWVVGLATQMMLTLLGLAIGAWSIDLRASEAMQGIPLGTGIWTGLSMLIAAFVGGYVAARLAGAANRMDGVYHGATVWGLNWLAFAWLTTTALSFMIGGIFSTLGTAIQSIGRGVGTAASKVASNANITLSTDDIRKQVESVLAATGKQELQPEQIKKDAGAATEKAQSGQPLTKVTDSALSELQQKLMALDRDAAINVMVTKFGMTRPQAEQVVQSTLGAIGPIKQAVQNAKEQSVDVATQALNQIGSAAWWLFLLAIVTLGASLGGGAFGIVKEAMLSVEGRSLRDTRRTG